MCSWDGLLGLTVVTQMKITDSTQNRVLMGGQKGVRR